MRESTKRNLITAGLLGGAVTCLTAYVCICYNRLGKLYAKKEPEKSQVERVLEKYDTNENIDSIDSKFEF